MWFLEFVLPNLNLPEPVGNDYIALVPHNDPRVTAITSAHLPARQLVGRFSDQFGNAVSPSALITNRSASPSIKKGVVKDAIVAFRNAFALSVIVEAHELSLGYGHWTHPHFSDYFDLYPVTCARNYSGLYISSPALLGAGYETESFRGQTSPALSGPKSPSLGLGASLFQRLEGLWRRRFVWGRQEWSTSCLFRSLEMAYEASSIPYANLSTIYDYGSRASLWVSAFEILSHPRKGKANLEHVLNQLGEYDWSDRAMRRKSYGLKLGKKKIYRANLVQRLYKDLYEARCDFLHGNRVHVARLLPFRKIKRPPLTAFAPLIYKVALLAFLGPVRDWQRGVDVATQMARYGNRLRAERRLATQILKAKTGVSK